MTSHPLLYTSCYSFIYIWLYFNIRILKGAWMKCFHKTIKMTFDRNRNNINTNMLFLNYRQRYRLSISPTWSRLYFIELSKFHETRFFIRQTARLKTKSMQCFVNCVIQKFPWGHEIGQNSERIYTKEKNYILLFF